PSATRFGAFQPLMSWAARLTQDERQLAVGPDLGVVVHDDLEDRRGPSGIELPDSLGDRDLQAVPGEAQPAAGAACLERRRLDPLPLRVVEIGGAGVRADVVGSIWGAARLQIGPGGAKADRHDLGVAVAPLALDEWHA